MKLLNAIIIVNLLLGGGIIYVSTTSFLQKKVMKATALELESTAQQISDNLAWGEEVAWELAEDKKQLPFNLPQPASVIELQDLEANLNDLVRFAKARQAQLTLRHNELVSTEMTLQQTRNTLATRERELRAAQDRKAQVTRTLDQTKEDLAEARKEVAILNRTKQGLERSIESKNDSITDLNNDLASVEIDLETRIQEIENTQGRYERCRFGAAGSGPENAKEVRGLRGKILAVNKDWEYVVINKGMVDNMTPDLVALVHRGKEYIGKLKVIKVEEDVAVAAILPESIVAPEGLVPGDTLFF